MDHVIRIGHPAYSDTSANRLARMSNSHLAVMELIARGVPPSQARGVVKLIEKGYPHSSALHTVYARGEVIEVCLER